ncbi:diguanylate cyclase [Novosphingobium sp. ZW T3_23]|uniref:sensor domain-containing diguanylate cyclase n=1 Tax=Novosphingobium sp. ZW T3_23 TaxID=3378084 RepID=UPI00385370F6
MFPPLSRRLRLPLREAVLTATTYFVCAAIALQLTRFDAGIAVVWLAGPVLFARLCSTPRRHWIAIGLACAPLAFCASILFGFHGLVALPLSMLCIVEAFAAAWLVRRIYPRFGRFQSLAEVGCFLLVAGALIPAITAFAAAYSTHVTQGLAYWPAWRDWFAGHALGFITFAPPLLLCLRGETRQWIASAGRKRMGEAAVLLGLVLVASLITFGQNAIPLVIVPFVPTIAATLRLGRFGAVSSILILVTVGLSLSLAGRGPTTLLASPMAVKFQVLQIYFASVVLIVLPLAAELRSRRRLVERLHTAEALHRAVLDRMSDIVVRVGADGLVRYASPSALQVSGYAPAELVGRSMFDLILPEDVPVIDEARGKALAHPDDAAIVEYRVRCKNGDIVWVESHIRGIVDEDGRTSGTVSIIREITRRRQLVENLTAQAMTDHLTGALNRRAFDEALALMLDASGPDASKADTPDQQATAGCLALFDLDHFKQINDRYGHATGDDVLVRFVAILRGAVREGDLVARLGGEEFAALLGGLSLDQAHLVCERIRTRFEEAAVRDPSGARVEATVSIGIAPLSSGQDGRAVMALADDTLYRAKQEGRNRTGLPILPGSEHRRSA